MKELENLETKVNEVNSLLSEVMWLRVMPVSSITDLQLRMGGVMGRLLDAVFHADDVLTATQWVLDEASGVGKSQSETVSSQAALHTPEDLLKMRLEGLRKYTDAKVIEDLNKAIQMCIDQHRKDTAQLLVTNRQLIKVIAKETNPSTTL